MKVASKAEVNTEASLGFTCVCFAIHEMERATSWGSQAPLPLGPCVPSPHSASPSLAPVGALAGDPWPGRESQCPSEGPAQI